MIAQNNVDFDASGKYKLHHYRVYYRMSGTRTVDHFDYQTRFDAVNNISAKAMACEWLKAFPATEPLLHEPWVSNESPQSLVMTKGRSYNDYESVEPQLILMLY